jgi:hypothetical protein
MVVLASLNIRHGVHSIQNDIGNHTEKQQRNTRWTINPTTERSDEPMDK